MSATPEPSVERWRGRIETELGEHDRRLDAINGQLERVWKQLVSLEVAVAKLTVRVSIAAAAGGIVASVVVKFLSP